jgi:hypothetical protein
MGSSFLYTVLFRIAIKIPCLENYVTRLNYGEEKRWMCIIHGRGGKYITISVEILKEKDHLGDLGVHGRIPSNGVQTSRI